MSNTIDLGITVPGVALYKSGEALVISKDKKLIRQVPIRRICSVSLFTDRVRITGSVINLCMEHNIPILFMGNAGTVTGIIASPKSDSPELQLAQARVAESIPFVLSIGCAVIDGKIRNQMNLLKYFGKSRKSKILWFKDTLHKDLKRMDKSLVRLHTLRHQNNYSEIEEFRNKLFGIEGQAAISYWHAYGSLLPKQTPFPSRVCQGATDPVNSSLNYGYALLRAKVEHAVVRAGLSLQTSFLHSPQRNRSSLVFDLMEEFRPWAIDRPVLNFICQKHKEAVIDKNGRLSQTTKKLLVQTILERWKKDKIPELIYEQVTKLVQSIKNKGDYRTYKFKW